MTYANLPPDPHRCPVCSAGVASPRCENCRADLSGPEGQELWSVDEQLFRLSQRRQQLLALIGAPSPAATPPPAGVGVKPATQPPAQRWTPPRPAVPTRGSGPQVSSILLGLGVMLLVVAALVFAAVSWSRLGAAAQGALLIGLTLAAGFGSHQAKRHKLGGTAEALGVLTVVMAPLVAQAVRVTLDLPDIDDRTWSNFGVWSWWPAAMIVLGAAAMAFGKAVGIRGSRAVGAVLVQLGPVIWVALSPMPLSMKAATLALQAGVVASGPAAAEDDGPTAALWTVGSAVVWTVALLTALSEAFSIGDGVADRLGAAAALATCAIAAAVAAWRSAERAYWTDIATAAAAVATVLAIGRGLAGSVPPIAWWPAMGLVGAAAIAIGDRARLIRSMPVLATGWVTTGIAATPLAGNLIAVLTTAARLDVPWRTVGTARVEVEAFVGLEPAWASALFGVVALATALLASHRRLSGEQFRVVGAGLMVIASTTVPALAGATLWLVMATTLATALALAASAPFVHLRVASGWAMAVLLLGVLWSLELTPLMLVAGAVAFVIGALGVVRGVQNGDAAVAAGNAAVAAVAVVAEAGLTATAFGADPGWAWAVAASAAAVLLAAVPMPALEGWPRALVRKPLAATGEPRPFVHGRDPQERAMFTGGAVLLAAHAYALFSTADGAPSATSAATMALIIGTVALATVAARTRASLHGWWIWAVSAGVEGLAVLWIRTAEADVSTWEAYTLPLAALIGFASWLAARSRDVPLSDVSSWHLEGPALAMACGPTVFLALSDPGITRLLIGLAVGVLLLALGADQRRRAPFDIGTTAMVVLGLHTLLPYAAEVPRWVSLGTVGAILIALGATFEQRRQDFRQMKDRYSALG